MSNLYKYLNQREGYYSTNSVDLDYIQTNNFIKENNISLLKKDEVELYEMDKTFFSQIYGKKTKKQLDAYFKKNKIITAEDFTSSYKVKKGKIKYSKIKIQEKIKTTKNFGKKNLLLEELEQIKRKERRLEKRQEKIIYDEGFWNTVKEKTKNFAEGWSKLPGKIMKMIFNKRVMKVIGIIAATAGVTIAATNPMFWAIGVLILLIYYSYKKGGEKDPVNAFKYFRTVIADPIKDKITGGVKSAFEKTGNFFKQPGVNLVLKLLLLGAKVVLSIAVNPIAFIVQFFSGLLLKSCIDTVKATITFIKSVKEKNTQVASAGTSAQVSESVYFGEKITPEIADSFLNATENLKYVFAENLHNTTFKKSVFLEENNLYFEGSSSGLIKNINKKLISTQKVKMQAVSVTYKIDDKIKLNINLANNIISIKNNNKKVKKQELEKLGLEFNADSNGNFLNLKNEQLTQLIDKLTTTKLNVQNAEPENKDTKDEKTGENKTEDKEKDTEKTEDTKEDTKEKTENKDTKEETKPEDKTKNVDQLYAIIDDKSTIDNLKIQKEKPKGDILGYIELKKANNESNPNSKQYTANVYVKKLFDVKSNGAVSTFFEALAVDDGFAQINSDPATVIVNQEGDNFKLSMKGSVGNFFSRESNSTKKGKISDDLKNYLTKTIADVKTATSKKENYKSSKKQSAIDAAIDDVLLTRFNLEPLNDTEIDEIIKKTDSAEMAEEKPKAEETQEEKDEKTKTAEDAIKANIPFLQDETVLGSILFAVISAIAFSYHFFTGGLSNIPLDPTAIIGKVETVIDQLANGQAYAQTTQFFNSLFSNSGATINSSLGGTFDKLLSKIGLSDTADVDSGMLDEMDPSLNSVILKKMDFVTDNEDLMNKLVLQKLGVKSFSEVLDQNPDFDLGNYVNNLSTQEFAEMTKNLSSSELKDLLNSPFGSQMQKGIIDHLKDSDPNDINLFNEKFGSVMEESSMKDIYAETLKNKLAENEYYDKFAKLFGEKAQEKGVISWFKDKIGMTDADTEGTKILKSILKDKYDQLNLEGLTPKQQYMAILKSIRQANDEDFINTYIDNAEKLDQYPELKKMFMDTITENPTMLNKFAGEQITEALKDFDTSYIQKALIAKAESMGIAKDKYDVFIGKVMESIKNPNDPFFKSAGDEFQKQIIKATYKINPDGAYIPNPDKAKDIAKLFEERYDFIATKAGTVPDNTWTGKMLQSLKDGSEIDPNAPIKPPAPIPSDVTDTPIPKPVAPDQPAPAPTPVPDQPAPTPAPDQPVKPPVNNEPSVENTFHPNDVNETLEKIKTLTDEQKNQLKDVYDSVFNNSTNPNRIIFDSDMKKAMNILKMDFNNKSDHSIIIKLLEEAKSNGFKDAIIVKTPPTSTLSSYQYTSKDEEFLFNEYFKFENKLNKFKK